MSRMSSYMACLRKSSSNLSDKMVSRLYYVQLSSQLSLDVHSANLTIKTLLSENVRLLKKFINLKNQENSQRKIFPEVKSI